MAETTATPARPLVPVRDLAAFAVLALIVLAVFLSQGSVYSLRVMVEAACYAVLTLGLTIQWGYAGLFNVGVMGFLATGAATSMLVSYPTNPDFWNSPGPALVAMFVVKLAICGAAIWLANRAERIGFHRRLKGLLVTAVLIASFVVISWHMTHMADVIESQAGWVGGLGLPVILGWLVAGLVAGLVAWFVGRVCLGLRSDYLAIATLGIAQIIKTFLKNADWLTRGTLTVSPLPWPVPTPANGDFAFARGMYLIVVVIVMALVYLALQRAYYAPWGRMMRAIRDREDAAAAMGKDVTARRREIFVLGCVVMGIGGAMLIHFAQIYDPSGFIDLNHTFLIWVMMILGGAGNNRGAIFGAIFVYIAWTISEPIALWLFHTGAAYAHAWTGWNPPSDLDSRALQMRVFVVGLTITLVLRYAPRGILPEPEARH
ncbi:branched-chain amino acid ABC transporter permease [Pararhizobium mangrovi]|uniref:Branched-chain amino acid ABC transporter permease n=1 Tax=Pararhizobium mangrovi TaxID=2590452 RepID=A0A506TX46_9HYPH|nr:branched-chain amino acid ABC transporter permease [Pararhizobium mangrovi]TPW26612.1 branched-chain amino acid ABC transporter permease [Pararhizobium mangrovi]